MNHEQVRRANQDFYDEIADRYLELESYAYGDRIVESVRENLRLVADLSGKPSALLDFGCGSGFLSKIAAENNLFDSGVGIDISQKQVELYNSTLAGTEFHALLSDGTSLPFEDDSFSAVCGYSVLHHFFDPALALAEAARVVRRGGIIYFDFEPDEKFRKKFRWLVTLRRRIFDHSPSGNSSLEAVAEYHNNFTLGLSPRSIASQLLDFGFETIQIGRRFPDSFSGVALNLTTKIFGSPSPLFYIISKKVE